MNCENCGAEIDKDEEYCPNCGMQLIDIPSKHKKINKSPKPFSHESIKSTPKSESIKKPIKQKYTEDPQSPDYSQYEEEYEEKTEKESSKGSSGMINIILFIFIALLLGFVVGLILFGTQSIPGLQI